jgi:Ca-activated chloride channel family protein
MKIVINPIRPALCEADQNFHVLVRLQSEPQAGFKRTPLNLVLVVDRSGSMTGSKLTEAKRCVLDLIKRMHPEDSVGVVQYDNEVETVTPLIPVGQVSGVLEALIQGITANGRTDLHGGWLQGGEMLAPVSGREAACRVILLSDGQANHGLTHTQRICTQVAALAEAGVTTTTVGLGSDFNEELMTAMAKAGQGSAHYGERAIDLAETFDAEIGLLSQLQWRNVEMSVTSGPGSLKLLNTYEGGPEGWRLPSVAMGSECWALFKMNSRDALRHQQQHGALMTVEVRATDASGERFTFTGHMQALPQVQEAEYADAVPHELVQRRINELSAAALQLRIREAALRCEWREVAQLLAQLEDLGRHEPWVAASIAFTRQLMQERDQQRMSKEMLYKSVKMNQRLSSTDEASFSLMDAVEMPAFLRRKMAEGRRTEL